MRAPGLGLFVVLLRDALHSFSFMIELYIDPSSLSLNIFTKIYIMRSCNPQFLSQILLTL